MLTFFESTNQINRNHHAYHKLHNTTTAILEISEEELEAADDNKIAQIMMIDESAAFDCVNHNILEKKLELYNFSTNSRDWITNYLSHRSQFVSVGAKNSNMTPVLHGVPQGSVLGPLLYTIYTNELPNTIKDELKCPNHSHNDNSQLFGLNCSNCGNITCFADDAIYITVNKTRDENQAKISTSLNRISTFLNTNQLTINQDQTTLCEFMVRQKKAKQTSTQPTLNITDNNGNPQTIKKLQMG